MTSYVLIWSKGLLLAWGSCSPLSMYRSMGVLTGQLFILGMARSRRIRQGPCVNTLRIDRIDVRRPPTLCEKSACSEVPAESERFGTSVMSVKLACMIVSSL